MSSQASFRFHPTWFPSPVAPPFVHGARTISSPYRYQGTRPTVSMASIVLFWTSSQAPLRRRSCGSTLPSAPTYCPLLPFAANILFVLNHFQPLFLASLFGLFFLATKDAGSRVASLSRCWSQGQPGAAVRVLASCEAPSYSFDSESSLPNCGAKVKSYMRCRRRVELMKSTILGKDGSNRSERAKKVPLVTWIT